MECRKNKGQSFHGRNICFKMQNLVVGEVIYKLTDRRFAGVMRRLIVRGSGLGSWSDMLWASRTAAFTKRTSSPAPAAAAVAPAHREFQTPIKFHNLMHPYLRRYKQTTT